jgi:hypothetical protein
MMKEAITAMIKLDEMSVETQKQLHGLLAPQGVAVLLVHPLYFGGNPTERKDIIERNLKNYQGSDNDRAALEAAIRQEQDSYLLGLQEVLDSTNYPVGILFEGVGTQHRVEELKLMDSSGRPWVVVTTHNYAPDPFVEVPPTEENFDAAWKSTIESMVNLGIQYVHIGGCYLILDKGTIVSPDEYHSCINQVIWKLRGSESFEGVATLLKGVYTQPLPPLARRSRF